jgi:hypothetical protein
MSAVQNTVPSEYKVVVNNSNATIMERLRSIERKIYGYVDTEPLVFVRLKKIEEKLRIAVREDLAILPRLSLIETKVNTGQSP